LSSAPIFFLVIAAAVVGDFEDFVTEVSRLTLVRENIQDGAASEPTEYRGKTPR
jgi:hypothetical protein